MNGEIGGHPSLSILRHRFRIATAPVSFGFYGPAVAASGDPNVLLSHMRSAGFDGTELGPPGLFGSLDHLSDNFESHSLAVVGGYIPLELSSTRWDEDLSDMHATLDELQTFGASGPLAILADVGTKELMARPARHWSDRALALDDLEWRRLADRVERATSLADAKGVTCSFHPHLSTYIESPWEVERLLALTDIDLTLDTAHLFLAGASSVECFRAWSDRINHIHVKDAHIEILRNAQESGATDFDSWWDETCCALGDGDVDLVPFLAELARSSYDGWIVIEHDRKPAELKDFAEVAQVQARNLTWLERQLADDN